MVKTYKTNKEKIDSIPEKKIQSKDSKVDKKKSRK